MKLVFVCSPYRGNVEKNVERAQNYCRKLVSAGCNPVAPHLFYAQFLDDTNESERRKGIQCGKELLLLCEEVHVLGMVGDETEGMLEEIELARTWEIPVHYKNDKKKRK